MPASDNQDKMYEEHKGGERGCDFETSDSLN